MTRLPTVTLRNRKTGKKIIINASDYALDLRGYQSADWVRVGETRGDATDDDVRFEKGQARWAHEKAAERDAPRMLEQNRIAVPVVTTASAPAEETAPTEAPAPAEPVSADSVAPASSVTAVAEKRRPGRPRKVAA